MRIKDNAGTPFSRRGMVLGGSAALAGITAARVHQPEPVVAQQLSDADQNTQLMRGKLSNRVAVITGAARGIGRACAVAMAKEGADVVAYDIARQIATVNYPMGSPADLAETKRLVEAEKRRCLTVQGDVRSSEQLQGAIAQAIAEFGKVDILVANAGIVSYTKPLIRMTDQEWDDVVDVNLTGTAKSLRAVIPHMVERQQGRIIVISSVASRYGTPNVSHYGAARWGAVGLAKAAALELAKSGVTVNAVCPTSVNTPMTHNEANYRMVNPDNPTREGLEARFLQFNELPIPYVEPEDVASAVVFLASEDARYLSGGAIDVGAGSNARWSA